MDNFCKSTVANLSSVVDPGYKLSVCISLLNLRLDMTMDGSMMKFKLRDLSIGYFGLDMNLEVLITLAKHFVVAAIAEFYLFVSSTFQLTNVCLL